MKLFTPDQLPETAGSMHLYYGRAGVGKSVSTIQSAPDPILYIMVEPRDVKKFLTASGRGDVQIQFAFPEGWDDTIAFVNDLANFENFNSVVLDSISHLISISLSNEIEDEAFDSLDKKKGIDKPLAIRTKMSQEGYGALAGQMLRFTDAISRLSQVGKTVVCLAREEQNPKFNRALQGAPALKGQEYSKHMQGFFDFIGYVYDRSDENGNTVFPPLVSFESDGSYWCKWNGLRPEGGLSGKPFNIQRIIEVSQGK
jgi:hypothetical protein